MKQKNRAGRDPYYSWKIVNMVLACAVLVIAVLVILGEDETALVWAAFFLGALMCALSGIMELSRGRRVIGYICSVFAGVMAVALLISVIGVWW